MQHQAVLLKEAIEALAIKPDGIYLDGTFGRGGHTQAILDQLSEQGKLFAIDRDHEAQAVAESMDDDRLTFARCDFSSLPKLMNQYALQEKLDGVLFDFGVSSPQLDQGDRGFSFMHDGPLDMRMDQRDCLTAKEIIDTYTETQLADLFYQFGQERYSRRIARAILHSRSIVEIKSTQQLAEIIKTAHPKWEKHKHPATRCFQALRIAVNQELLQIEQGLNAVLSMLKPNGRLSVISFHSLEDRMVKQFIRQHSNRQAHAKMIPKMIPLREDQIDQQLDRKGLQILNKVGKKIRASRMEISNNPRARSAILRVAQKRCQKKEVAR